MNSVMPVRSEHVRMLRFDEECVICDVEGRPLFTLNDTASAVWELCDGSIRIDEAIDAICSVCAVHPDVALDDVTRTLDAFGQAGLIRWP